MDESIGIKELSLDQRRISRSEARNSFCLGAYRPYEGAPDAEDTSELYAATTPFLRQVGVPPPSVSSGRSNLPRTDAPLSRFAPATDITSQRRHSMMSVGADIATEERRMSLDLSYRKSWKIDPQFTHAAAQAWGQQPFTSVAFEPALPPSPSNHSFTPYLIGLAAIGSQNPNASRTRIESGAYAAPSYSAPTRMSVDEVWESLVMPKREVNPFNNIPNTFGFFLR